MIEMGIVLKLRARLGTASVALLVLSTVLASVPARAQNGTTARAVELDRHALIALEGEWLANVRDPATLDRILAPDFVHAVPTGDFLTKKEHISWCSAHPLPPNRASHFEKLDVRVFADLAIASGIVDTRDGPNEVDRSVFTDVFAYRSGRWQAVHAQETKIEPHLQEHQ